MLLVSYTLLTLNTPGSACTKTAPVTYYIPKYRDPDSTVDGTGNGGGGTGTLIMRPTGDAVDWSDPWGFEQNYSGWNPRGTTTCYDAVDDVTPDYFSTYVALNDTYAWGWKYFYLADHTTESGTIVDVTLYACARQYGGAVDEAWIKLCVVYPWSFDPAIEPWYESNPPSINLTRTWTNYSQTYTEYCIDGYTDPRPWTWTDIDNLRLLILGSWPCLGDSYPCVTQFYVLVTYTTDGSDVPQTEQITAQDAIADIKAYVGSADLAKKVKKSLLNTLDDAIRFLDHNKLAKAVKELKTLINEVHHKDGKKIPTAIATEIIKQTEYIISFLK